MQRPVAALLFSASILISAFSQAKASSDFLPLMGREAEGTHVHINFMRVKRSHEAMGGATDEEVRVLCEAGDHLYCGYQLFQEKVDGLRGHEGLALLRRVNSTFNRLPYKLDEDLYGVDDYWATPAEFLAYNGGDCEDYALTKYHALKELGWPVERMNVVVLWDERARLHHAVLLVEFQGGEWLLDDARKNIVRSSQAPNYLPYYAVNEVESSYFHMFYADADVGIRQGPEQR